MPKARRKPIAVSQQPEADSREPGARSRKSALRPCPPLSKGGWRAPIYSLAPHCLSGGRGPRSGEGGIAEGTPEVDSREPGLRIRKPEAGSREPSAGSRKSALRPCPPLSKGGWRAPIYSLAPHCLSGGRGPRSGEGGIAEGTPEADSRQPEADSRQPEANSQQLVGEHLTHYSSILPFITQSNDWNP